MDFFVNHKVSLRSTEMLSLDVQKYVVFEIAFGSSDLYKRIVEMGGKEGLEDPDKIHSNVGKLQKPWPPNTKTVYKTFWID